MKAFSFSLLIGLVAATPAEYGYEQDYKNVADIKKIYETHYDIVKVLVPLNSVNHRFFGLYPFSRIYSNQYEKMPIFFLIKADISPDGRRSYRGLYIVKDDTEKKLLNNGRDMAASVDDSKEVFFAATDGIYVYNEEKNNVEKYGSINDHIIDIEKEKLGDVLYILNSNKEVYKVNEEGYVKEKIEDIVDAEQIALDYSNNIYFYGSDKKFYVRGSEGVKLITGLPNNPLNVVIFRQPYNYINDEEMGILAKVDNELYLMCSNGTSTLIRVFDNMQRSMHIAVSAELLGVAHWTSHKKIYVLNQLKDFVRGLDNDNNKRTFEIVENAYNEFRNQKS